MRESERYILDSNLGSQVSTPAQCSQITDTPTSTNIGVLSSLPLELLDEIL